MNQSLAPLYCRVSYVVRSNVADKVIGFWKTYFEGDSYSPKIKEAARMIDENIFANLYMLAKVGMEGHKYR